MGEIVLRGNTIMKGYHKDEAATEAAFAGGAFHTGDVAVQHPDGFLEIKDRIKDIIISGGENISSIEVEAVLYRHPAVSAAAVVAKHDVKWGETPCAFVEFKPGANATADELNQFCRQHLPGFKVPKHYIFETLPKTSTGKIEKYKPVNGPRLFHHETTVHHHRDGRRCDRRNAGTRGSAQCH
ncbi:AMP-binding enzyme [Mesorhizobium atlanticum]